MTNNPTIDGVSRELRKRLDNLTDKAGGVFVSVEYLRALLDAPVVERQPVGEVKLITMFGPHPSVDVAWETLPSAGDKLYTAPPAPVAVVPGGWKLVPVEPTDQMALAALKVSLSGSSQINGVGIWKAMIDSSPDYLDATAALNGSAK
jgi:hypothetical protein